MATTSAKSSMSIFSSWEAAPYSGVMTYSETSTSGTIAASPWPMPGVSTITRSKPAAWHAATRSAQVRGQLLAGAAGRHGAEEHRPRRRCEFIRIRSPSSAPPPRRRLGSTARTAIRSLSSWSRRKRRTSSSVSEDLPDPPVPVMPSTGTLLAGRRRADRSASASDRPRSSTVMARASAAVPPGAHARRPRRLRCEVDVAVADQLVDHSGQAEPLPVLRAEDVHAARAQQLDLVGDDDPAATAEDPDVAGAALGQPLDEVAEVLDVPALVGADRHALHVLLHGGGHHLLDAAVVPEVDHLAALGLQDPPHDRDRRVVAVEQARRGHEPHRVRWVRTARGQVSSGHQGRRCGRYLDIQISEAHRLTAPAPQGNATCTSRTRQYDPSPLVAPLPLATPSVVELVETTTPGTTSDLDRLDHR